MKSFKSLLIEASYAGNLGLMELLKFHQMATREQSNQIKFYIENNEHDKAWELIQSVTKTKLHPSGLA